MQLKKPILVLGTIATLGLGSVGGSMLTAMTTHAQTNTPPIATPVPINPTSMAPLGLKDSNHKGFFKSDEDSAHEAKESPEREAQEDAGVFHHFGKHK